MSPTEHPQPTIVRGAGLRSMLKRFETQRDRFAALGRDTTNFDQEIARLQRLLDAQNGRQ